jgi:hypothetical protein
MQGMLVYKYYIPKEETTNYFPISYMIGAFLLPIFGFIVDKKG